MNIYSPEIVFYLVKADLVDEVSETKFFFGYLKPGGAEDTASCLIVKMEKTGNVWKRTYVNGNKRVQDQIWNDREDLNYTFQK